MTEKTIAYGAVCTWWDSKEKVRAARGGRGVTTEKTAERVERLLSGLSRSYPFLDLSRKTGARYAAVLLCADALDMSESEWNAHHVDAIIELSLDQLTMISRVMWRGRETGVIW